MSLYQLCDSVWAWLFRAKHGHIGDLMYSPIPGNTTSLLRALAVWEGCLAGRVYMPLDHVQTLSLCL